MPNDLLGAHLSTAGGAYNVFKRAAKVGARTVQIFTKSNKAYFSKPLTQEEIDRFKDEWKKSDVQQVITHAAYLINIGSSDANVVKKSCSSLRGEVERCHQLGIPYLVLHPGAHTGGGVEESIAKIAKGLNEVLANAPGDVMILLETAAGQGTTIGARFPELRAIYDACEPEVRKRLGICLDTCHVFAAGHNIAIERGYNRLWAQFDALIGRKLLKVIHLNDSKMECNTRRDRHANLGEGYIPTEMLKRFADEFGGPDGIPVILETPSTDGIAEYKEELALLRG